jgi:hypothetical protein
VKKNEREREESKKEKLLMEEKENRYCAMRILGVNAVSSSRAVAEQQQIATKPVS